MSATLPGLTNPAAGRTTQGQGQTRAAIPFRRSTRKHMEPFFDSTITMTAGSTQISPINIPAYGFIRGIFIRVDATGGVGSTTSAVLAGDAPFNALTAGLLDVNGAPIYGPFMGTQGTYLSYVIAKYGGYRRAMDARQNFIFGTGSSGGNFSYRTYLPLEISRMNGIGALTNLNAAAAYQLFLTLNPSTTVFGTSPAPTLPAIRIRLWLDAWAQPPAHDLLGNMTSPAPPAVNTTQFWSVATFPVNSGSNIVRLTRLGQFIRTLIFVLYGGASNPNTRVDNDWPDPAELWLDDYQLASIGQDTWQGWHVGAEYNLNPNAVDGGAGQVATGLSTRDTGVYPYSFADDGDSLFIGSEHFGGYLPTLQSSRLEIRGTFGSTNAVKQLFVLTNDVAPAGDIWSTVGPLS